MSADLGKSPYNNKKAQKLCGFKTTATASILRVEGITECEQANSPQSSMPQYEDGELMYQNLYNKKACRKIFFLQAGSAS
ncbi:hypothetical protein ACQXR1_20340 [Bacillus sp. ATD]|uniref:hypothetical protein n=1 Tax=Bacillus sp. ATD TaxID=3422305 RepID=UPI003D33139B